MKKLFLLVLALALVCASSLADAPLSFYDRVTAAGLDVSEVVADGEMFTQESVDALKANGNTVILSDGDYFQILLWYQGDKPYGIAVLNVDGEQDMGRLRGLFLEALNAYGWDAAAYTFQDGDVSTVSLNYAPGLEDGDGEYFDTYEAFADAVTAAISNPEAVEQTSEIDAVSEFVLNAYLITPQTIDQAFNYNALNLILSDGDSATITWTDARKSVACAVSGDTDEMVEVYGDLIPLYTWDTLGVFDGAERVLVYDHTENGTDESAATYEEYAAAVEAYFSPAAPAEDAANVRDYVLNTNSKKFHLPSCSAVDQMKKKNRQDYTGTREDLINRGYKPCGTCNP